MPLPDLNEAERQLIALRGDRDGFNKRIQYLEKEIFNLRKPITTVTPVERISSSSNQVTALDMNGVDSFWDQPLGAVIHKLKHIFQQLVKFSSSVYLTSLTASRPLKLDASNIIVTDQIDLSSTNDIKNILDVPHGGSGAATITGMIKGTGVTAFGAVTGTLNRISKWVNANYIGDANITDDGSAIGFLLKLGTYNNIATVGEGTPPIYFYNTGAGLSASVGSTNVTVGGGLTPAGVYKLMLYAATAGTGTGSAQFTLGWNDGRSARTQVLTLNLPAFNWFSNSSLIRADGINHITYSITYTGTGSYDYYIILEKLA